MQNSTQIQLEFPTVMGQPFEKLPEDLFIPPNALEICLETFSGPMDLLLYLIKKEMLKAESSIYEQEVEGSTILVARKACHELEDQLKDIEFML